ncbi:MAG: 5'-3' exonuclease H3TH domain-containing protein [Gemmatimonadota bacterium]
MPSPHLLIIDAQSLGARAAHVAPATADAARLWCQMVRGAVLDAGATHVIAAWDHHGPTFRHTLFPQYKHRRTGETRTRVTPIREAVEATGIASCSVDGFEGDDVVASVMATLRGEARITLLSNDSDLLQFVSDGVDVATYVGVGKGPQGARIKPWSIADVEARYGVRPIDIPAFKALCGETGDDIPGVAGIGKGMAVKILRRWGSIEKAFEATEFVSHRDDTARLAGKRDVVALMLQLTTIRQDAPLPDLALARCEVGRVNWLSGSAASARVDPATPVARSAAGPGMDDVPMPDEAPGWL